MGTTYTSTGSRELPLAWRCQKCGTLNFGTYKITVSGSAPKADRAKENMQVNMKTEAHNTLLDQRNCRFDRVRFKHKCSSCGDTPPWSNLPAIPPQVLRVLRAIALVATVVLFFLSIATPQVSQKQQYAIWSVAAATLFAMLAFACLQIKKKMLAEAEQAVAALPSDNKLRMASTGRELFQMLVEDGLLSVDEMQRLNRMDGFHFENGQNLSKRYDEMAAERKITLQKKQIRNIIIAAVLLLILGCYQIYSIQTSGWELKMEAANLFTANAAAGDKFIIYETLRIGNGEYKRTYLMSEQLASKPEEVGYIIEVSDSTEIAGRYMSGTVTMGQAYRIHTSLRIFDCHTGKYIGNPIELVGGDPPSSISSKSGSGYGSRPGSEAIIKAANELAKRVQ